MSDGHITEDFFLELANLPGGNGKKGPRRVATPEGASFYGQPIGTIITPDMIDAKRKENAAKGVKPAKGMLAKAGAGNVAGGTPDAANPQAGSQQSTPTSGAQNNAPTPGQGGNKYTQTGYPAPGIESTPPDWMDPDNKPEVPQLATGVKPSTISGPKVFKVGESKFDAPEGSKLFRPTNVPNVALVVTPDGVVHLFNDNGEVDFDAPTGAILQKKFSGDLKDDPNYSEEEFDKSEDITLDKLSAGTELVDGDGNTIFQKDSKGWKHVDLNLPMSDNDIKPLYDSGELSVKKPASADDTDDFDYGDDDDVAIQFDQMSEEDFASYLVSAEDGAELYFVAHDISTPDDNGISTEGPAEYKTLIKDGGDWKVKGHDTPVNQSLPYLKKNILNVEPSDVSQFGTWKKEQDRLAAETAAKTAESAAKEATASAVTDAANAEAAAAKTFKKGDKVEWSGPGGSKKSGTVIGPASGSPGVVHVNQDAAGKYAPTAVGVKASKLTNVTVKDAVSFDDAFEEQKAKLNEYNAQHLADSKLGSLVDPSFRLHALPGSKIYHNGTFFTKTDKPEMWDGGSSQTLTPGVFFKGKPGVYVAKNTFNDMEAEWKPANADSDDQPGSPASENFLYTAAKGSSIKVKGVYDSPDQIFYKNFMDDWVTADKPHLEIKAGQFVDHAVEGRVTVESLPSGDGAVLSVGDRLDEENLGEALTGTKVFAMSTNSNKPDFFLELQSNGAWKRTDSGDWEQTFEPFSTYPQHVLYVSDPKIGAELPEPKQLDIGDAPTVDWMNAAPVGSAISVEHPDIDDSPKSITKQDSGLWKFDIQSEGFGFTPEELAEHFPVNSPKIIDQTKKVPALGKKAGDVVTYDDFFSAPIGTTFDYHKNDGTLSEYSKLDENTVLMPKGVTQPIHHWKQSLDNGKVTFQSDTQFVTDASGNQSIAPTFDQEMEELDDFVQSMPSPTGDPKKDKEIFQAVAAEMDDKGSEYEYNTDEADLDSVPIGGHIQVLLYDDSITSTTYFTKLGDNEWAEEPYFMGEDTYTGIDVSTIGGKFNIISASALPGEGGDGEGGLTGWEKDLLGVSGSPSPITIDGPGGLSNHVFDIDEINAGINALESHPHSSVKYGVKSLPDDNGVKIYVEDLTAAAQEKYPNIKPKPAVIKLLKGHLGELTLDDEAKAGQLVTIGKEKPTKTAFGVTGMEVTLDELSEAIDVLEAFDGKLFKSQLSKANNPLGDLDFNWLVGKNKDKLEQKKDVISHLKGVLNKTVPVEKVTPESLDTSKPSLNPAQNIVHAQVNGILDAEVGDVVSMKTASGEILWTKTGVENWNSTNPAWQGWSDDELIGEFESQGALPEPVETNKSQSLKLLNDDDFSDLPVGATVLYTAITGGTSVKIVRSSNEQWINVETGKKFSHESVLSAPGEKKLWNLPKTYDAGSLPVGWDEFNGLVIGSRVRIGESAFYVKTGHDEWTNENFDKTYSPEQFESYANDNEIFLVSQPQPFADAFVANAAVQANADDDGNVPGQQFHNHLPGLYEHPTTVGKDTKHSLVIYADGTGTFTNSYGKVLPFSAEEVAKEMAFESWDYKGVPKTATPAPKKKSKKAPKPPANIEDIAPGVYYLGLSSSSDTDMLEKDTENNFTLYKQGQKTVPTASFVKTKLSQGKLLDENGNTAVVPKGHTGSVYLFGNQTTMDSLKTLLYDLDKSMSGYYSVELSSYGVYVDDVAVTKNSLEWFGDASPDSIKKTLITAIEGITGPTSDWKFYDSEVETMKLFNWKVGNSQAYFPEDLAQLEYKEGEVQFFNGAKAKERIDLISKSFDGAVGRHVGGMSAQQRRDWIIAFYAGNFKTMYGIEVAAAIKQGKSHDNGPKHPGYTSNEITNSIKWAPSVMGEKSVDTALVGEWTSDTNLLSQDEVNNYLMVANMQHPTFLSSGERHAWVTAHRHKNQWKVNSLSVAAKLRKEEGQAPLTDPLSWVDNVVPAKIYSKLFNDDPYPLTWGAYGNKEAANVYVSDFLYGTAPDVLDHKGDKVPVSKMSDIREQIKIENPYETTAGIAQLSAMRFFETLRYEADMEKQKKVYTIDATQTVKQSKHPTYNVSDQFGGKYFFKPRQQSKEDKYRSEVAHGANLIGRFLGFSSADSELVTIDGKYGQIQAAVPKAVKNLSGFNWSSTDATLGSDIAMEHVLDWFLDQDDNWAPNTILTSDGHAVGIDKDRAFRHYGEWNGLVPNHGMDVNTSVVYADLYMAIQNKSISKETADEIYLAVKRRAGKISKADEAKLTEMITDATKNRTDWVVPYKINGKTVSQDQQGLIAAVLDRKSKIPQQFEGMWKTIYANAGYGDLPEPKKSFLGEGQHSGLQDAAFHEAVLTVGAHGSSTLLAGVDTQEGYALSWEVNESNNNKAVFTQFALSPKKQNEALAWFKSNSDGSIDEEKATPLNFTYDDKYVPFLAAAKTVGAHSDDGQYNAGTLANYDTAKGWIEKDLAFYATGPQPGNVQGGGSKEDYITFPSGQQVHFNQVDQYKMMLEYYADKQSVIDTALAGKTKPAEIIAKYEPIAVHDSNVIYLDGNGQKLVKLANGKWIYVNSSIVSIVGPEDPHVQHAEAGDDGWKKYKDDPTPKAPPSFKAKLNSKPFDRAGKLVDFKLTHTSQPVHGAHGKEYEVALPTGEKIYFRNASSTGTVKAQQGFLTVKVPNAQNDTDLSAGIERAHQWLQTNLNLSFEDASLEDAELTYWRQMFPILTDRKHAPSSKWGKASEELKIKISGLNSTPRSFFDDFGAVASVDEQNQFFRDLWGKYFGQERVNKFIADEKFLPRYEALNYMHQDKAQGHPVWDRIDVDLNDLKSTNHMLGASITNADGAYAVADSGALLSAEQRLRVLGDMLGSDDQHTGGSNSVFFRVYNTSKTNGIHYILHPRAMLRTDTRSFHHSDAFGNPDHNAGYVWSDPTKSWMENVVDHVGKSGRETDLSNSAGLFGDLEILVFENNQAEKRNAAIQKLKERGITHIRGVAIEDRLVLRQNLAEAVKKLKESWYE